MTYHLNLQLDRVLFKGTLFLHTLCQMPSNIQISWEKRDNKANQKQKNLEVKWRIEVDFSSWDLIYWQAVKKLNLPFLWNFDFSSHFYSLVHISLFLPLLTMVSSNSKIIKEAPGHNYENLTLQRAQCPFKYCR